MTPPSCIRVHRHNLTHIARGDIGRRQTAPLLVVALATVAGLSCGQDGPTAPLNSYPCRVGWELILMARDPLQYNYYEVMRDGPPLSARASIVEISDSVEIALVRADDTLDASGTTCMRTETLVATPWTLVATDPAGHVTITQPTGTGPAVLRALTTGQARVRALIGPDTIGPATVTVVPRILQLVISPPDTVDVGAATVTVRISGRDSVGAAVPVYAIRTGWAVLGSSTIPVALWPSVSMSTPPVTPTIDATVTFPSPATVGTAQIKFTTRHATGMLAVTVPPAP